MRLLVIEDSTELAKLLETGLSKFAFEVDAVETAAKARDALAQVRYAAVILDLGLPDADGISILRHLREAKDPIPVLILTARGSVEDRVHGLQVGADDYLVKPFAFEELVARLKALLRRPGQLLGSSLSLANLAFDTETRQVFIDGRPEIFSARELAVLELLLRRQGTVVTKKSVEDHIFGVTADVSSNAVEVYVSRLRKLLADRGALLQIHTIRGVGYLLAESRSETLA
jgi:DNA-binding response OmpR family regulator